MEISDRVMKNITGRMIDLRQCGQDITLSNNICTVHTTFEGGFTGTLVLYADTALMARLAQQVLQTDEVSPQDIEDFAREYFNVICGQIVANLFRTAHISSRFHIPSFCVGKFVSAENGSGQCVLNYVSNFNEGVQLIQHIPHDLESR